MTETVVRSDALEVSVTVGVDTHLDEHVAVALDHLGRRLDALVVPTSGTGYAKLLRWAESLGRLERVGIEGAGSFGAGLARFLRSRSVEVLEVGRPKRRDQHRSGKSDPIDAELAARTVLSGTAIGKVKDTEGRVEMIRVLRAARRSAVKARAQAANQLKGMLITAPEDLRTELRGLTVAKLVRRAARFRPGDLPEDTTSATKFALRSIARRHQQFSEELKELDGQLSRLGFEVGTDPKGKVDVRPPVLSIDSRRTDEGGGCDAFVFACRLNEAVANPSALGHSEHRPSVARRVMPHNRDRRRAIDPPCQEDRAAGGTGRAGGPVLSDSVGPPMSPNLYARFVRGVHAAKYGRGMRYALSTCSFAEEAGSSVIGDARIAN